jgi:predicted dehydrogenase
MPGKLKVGIIGCGAIAQVQHLPHLRELNHEFEIGGLCDLSRKLLETVGDEYGVPPSRRFTDYDELLATDVDAVIVCPSASHAPPSIAAAKAGKHALVEKPMCTTVAEAEAIAAAAEQAGTVMMVAYMKQHDPAYLYAQARVHEMSDVRFIQVNHLHPHNDLHLREFKIYRFDDLPADLRERSRAENRAKIAQTLGLDPLPPDVAGAFSTVLGSLIHDIGNLHGMFGPPKRVVSTDVWADGRGITTVLEYDDEKRAVVSWVDLPVLWDFKETLEVYGTQERVLMSFPTGFARGLPTTVVVQGSEADGTPYKKELAWHENPFKSELRYFRECILKGKPVRTPAREVVHDIALVRDIILKYVERRDS